MSARTSRPGGRRIGWPRGAALALGLAVGLGGVGCASVGAPPAPRQALEPAGPGHVFATAEQAALDALAWCQREAGRAVAIPARSRAGTVHPVAGGFSYDEPILASHDGRRLRYRLAPRDVLHFRHLPSAAWHASGPAVDRLELRARMLVDARDPLHRPIYFMTPDRRVRVYAGRAAGERTLARFGPTWDAEAIVEVAWAASPEALLEARQAATSGIDAASTSMPGD